MIPEPKKDAEKFFTDSRIATGEAIQIDGQGLEPAQRACAEPPRRPATVGELQPGDTGWCLTTAIVSEDGKAWKVDKGALIQNMPDLHGSVYVSAFPNGCSISRAHCREFDGKHTPDFKPIGELIEVLDATSPI